MPSASNHASPSPPLSPLWAIHPSIHPSIHTGAREPRVGAQGACGDGAGWARGDLDLLAPVLGALDDAPPARRYRLAARLARQLRSGADAPRLQQHVVRLAVLAAPRRATTGSSVAIRRLEAALHRFHEEGCSASQPTASQAPLLCRQRPPNSAASLCCACLDHHTTQATRASATRRTRASRASAATRLRWRR